MNGMCLAYVFSRSSCDAKVFDLALFHKLLRKVMVVLAMPNGQHSMLPKHVTLILQEGLSDQVDEVMQLHKTCLHRQKAVSSKEGAQEHQTNQTPCYSSHEHVAGNDNGQYV